ncbi:MAG: hypothetical protein GY930_09400 [bacterium]|nr:hypothetical protein [bacterium]
MSSPTNKVLESESLSRAGEDLRAQAEALGAQLQDSLTALLSHLPRRILGPQALSDTLEGINVVTASRLMKAIGQKDSIATLQLLPGPKPLQRIVEAATALGLDSDATQPAATAIVHFDHFIREQAGDRSSLKAMLSAWLPEERREFENQRRQAVFKARHELDGVSSELELNTIILHPSQEPGKIDLVNIGCIFGIDRIRPDAVVKLGTRRLDPVASEEGKRPRLPENLDGEPATDGLHSVCLTEFCNSPPAPMKVDRHGPSMHYSLGPTGFGRASKVDLVVAEVNKGEFGSKGSGAVEEAHFFVLPGMCTRKLVFDLLLHEDVFAGRSPELLFYDTTSQGPVVAGDPKRELDRRHFSQSIETIGTDLRRARLLEFPAYGKLLENVFEKMKWRDFKFRAYRMEITYPLTGIQVSFAFFPKKPGEPIQK